MLHSRTASVLVIDDTEVNRYLVSRTLERAGFAVFSGDTGASALRLAHEKKPDLIVLDVHLPDISGLEVCRRLKSDPTTLQIPVLHLSATHVHSEDKVAGLDSGADAYLTQPVESRELLATINSLLRARRAEDALRRIQWLLHKSVTPESSSMPAAEDGCGDLTRFNTARTLLDAVGPAMLRQVAGEYLDLLDTSSAIYEINGDYALNIASSGWCRFLDESSRKLCGAGDQPGALASGKWHCHESCWNEASRPAMEQRKPMDIECRGGIRIYALPIIAGDDVVGCISVGYGDPPRNPATLQEIAERYGVTVDQLAQRAEAYESRPPFIVDLAKKRLHTAARLLGEIVERKRAEEKLAEAKEAAEAANRAKDHFLAVLSHELRTPLTPALAAVTMLQQQRGGDSNHATLEMIRRNIEMEARLIDDLLDVTRIVRGKVQLDRAPVPIGEVIERAVEVCRRDIEASKLNFTVAIDGCASILVNGDAVRLQQVVWNLLKNAMKFTQPGGAVEMRCRREEGNLVLEVSDTGEGIEPDVLPHIFNAFEQGGTRVTRQFGGLGLGLTITKGLVEMHGGTISAHSKGRGEGATFRVTLPVYASGSTTPMPASDVQNAEAPRPLRILLVEDHPDTAKIMRQVLSAKGHQVETAGDVLSAVDLVRRKDFDLLLSDLGLPDGSGVELLQSIRAMGLSMPAIALSGYGQDADLQQSRSAGFAEHLTKPVDVARLEGAIARASKPAAADA